MASQLLGTGEIQLQFWGVNAGMAIRRWLLMTGSGTSGGVSSSTTVRGRAPSRGHTPSSQEVDCQPPRVRVGEAASVPVGTAVVEQQLLPWRDLAGSPHPEAERHTPQQHHR
eukprot:scaffold122522_cov75-Phaeocystis_antarctica.AAC.2